MLEMFGYSFMIRAFIAGFIVALICPLIGIFLVLRRYSLMADTLAHVSLAGIAIGLLAKINPWITALVTTLGASFIIERLRLSKKVFGDSALALFLSGSLAVAVVLISLATGLNVNIFTYLFGSIVAVRGEDIYYIAFLGIVVITSILLFYKELVYITFDEETAEVTGIPTRLLNIFLIMLTALTITVSMRITGILLISALLVIPVVSALQLRLSFKRTVIWAEIFSLTSVFGGIITAYYLNLPAGGAIVLTALAQFITVFILKKGNT